jgi:hypothetical protein
MRDKFVDILAFGSAMGAVTIAFLAIFVAIADFGLSDPQKDPQALATCMKLHPERYCRITYNGLKP